jgi:hypothetical protein
LSTAIGTGNSPIVNHRVAGAGRPGRGMPPAHIIHRANTSSYNKSNSGKATFVSDNSSKYEQETIAGDQSSTADPVFAAHYAGISAGLAAGLVQQQKLALTSVYQLKSNPSSKSAKSKTTNPGKPSTVDWGILIGVNSSGSFTSKSQNRNFYGGSPIDVYPGLFMSVKLSDSWAINPQVKFFSPETISATYTHANQSKVDSGQQLSITASRKIYSISVPLYAVYKTGNIFSIKAGPVINFPVKQINASSLLQPASIKNDTTYYAKTIATLGNTNYQQSINISVSGGVSAQFKRWIFEAGYLKSLSGYRVSSGMGSATSNNGTLQFSIGFQLDKVKP